LDDCTDDTVSTWVESEDGNVGSFTCEHDDYFKINITSSSGNKTYYIEDNIGYVSPSVYTTFLYRYKTSDTNIKAKIVAVFASGNQTILSETSSTTWVKGSATLDTDKGSLTRIRLYANQATGQVYYDFVLVFSQLRLRLRVHSARPLRHA